MYLIVDTCRCTDNFCWNIFDGIWFNFQVNMTIFFLLLSKYLLIFSMISIMVTISNRTKINCIAQEFSIYSIAYDKWISKLYLILLYLSVAIA